MALRYYCPGLPKNGRVTLSDEVAHHLREVLRVDVGATIELFDGRGQWAEASVAKVQRRCVEVDIKALHRAEATGVRRVEVALSLPRGKRFDQVLEHGCELGVAAIRPLIFERSPPHARIDRRNRWERTLIAAAGQCGRSTIPEIEAARSLEDWLQELPNDGGGRWLAHPGGAWRPSAAQKPADQSALLVVGPEGGICEPELRALHAAGFEPLGIGPHILRIETAALAGLTLLLHAAPHVDRASTPPA